MKEDLVCNDCGGHVERRAYPRWNRYTECLSCGGINCEELTMDDFETVPRGTSSRLAAYELRLEEVQEVLAELLDQPSGAYDLKGSLRVLVAQISEFREEHGDG